ncbi:MAG TPA: thioesterase family protein [Orrella sp.]
MSFAAWCKSGTHHYFVQCGLPRWRDMQALLGCVAAPMLKLHAKYHNPSTFGDVLDVHTKVEQWRGKVFVHTHRIMRDELLICEGRQTRALCVKTDEGRIKAVTIPEFVMTACGVD